MAIKVVENVMKKLIIEKLLRNNYFLVFFLSHMINQRLMRDYELINYPCVYNK